MTDTRADLGTYLRRALDRRDDWHTIADLARAAQISETNLSRYIRGTTKPNLTNARAIATAISRPLLEVLIAADLITDDEASVDLTRPALDDLTDDDLLTEVRRRMAARATTPGVVDGTLPGHTRGRVTTRRHVRPVETAGDGTDR